ncbi:MAG: hypothetical protein R3Y19_02365 [Rikenellaceae bacterium]
MKHTLLSLLTLLLFALAFSNCSSNKPQFIEETALKKIIRDAVITNAVLTQPSHVKVDTLDYYTVILERAGYTMEDLKYTITEMANRKSSPLENIFSQIYNEITVEAAEANYHYLKMESFDSLVTDYVRDTIFQSDTTLFGKIESTGFEFVYPSAAEGRYHISFTYLTHGGYSNGLRQMNLSFVDSDTSDTGLKTEKLTSWIHRSFKERQYTYNTNFTKSGYDTLRFMLIESTNPPEKDSSWIKDIVITYMPEKELSRRIYLRDHTGIDVDSNYIKPYDFFAFETDSLTSDTLAWGWVLR